MAKVRLALGKSQQQFAKMFGVSASWIQAIELGARTINDELSDDIELRLGVKAKSLKHKRGAPTVWLLNESSIALLPQRISKPILAELRKLRAKPRERLRYQLALWKTMLPAMEEKAPRDEVVQKLLMLLDAAAAEQKQLTALSRLDRFIEEQIASLNLRQPIRAIAQKREQRLGSKPLTLPLGSLAKQQPRQARSRTSASPQARRKAVGSA